MTELTALLAAARQGDEQAAGQAFGLLYDDLRRLARSRLRQHQAMTLLDTTSLVHESYLKLIGSAALAVEDRHHFFAYAARVMRSGSSRASMRPTATFWPAVRLKRTKSWKITPMRPRRSSRS